MHVRRLRYPDWHTAAIDIVLEGTRHRCLVNRMQSLADGW